jgi:hypothetical protein
LAQAVQAAAVARVELEVAAAAAPVAQRVWLAETVVVPETAALAGLALRLDMGLMVATLN